MISSHISGRSLNYEIIAVISIWEVPGPNSGFSSVCLDLNLCFTACSKDALALPVNKMTQDPLSGSMGKSLMSVQLVFLPVKWCTSRRLPLTTVPWR